MDLLYVRSCYQVCKDVLGKLWSLVNGHHDLEEKRLKAVWLACGYLFSLDLCKECDQELRKVLEAHACRAQSEGI